MVPVEPISLTIGIASLFSTCIECIEYFKAAQTLGDDLKILLVKLDIEKTRLLIWGNAVGILRVDDSERAPDLRDPTKVAVITKCLELIKALFSDTEKLEKEYGVKVAIRDEENPDSGVDSLSRNSMNVFKTSYKRFWVRNAASSATSGVISKTKWAIHDKAKFEDLRGHLKDFIDGLHEIVPVKKESQDAVIQGDISSILDLSKLHLVRSACSEAHYESWSEMASSVIEESNAGTVDRRRTEKWLKGIADVGDELTAPAAGLETDQFQDKLSISTKVFFVFTSEWLNRHLTSSCSPQTLGKMTFDESANLGFTAYHEYGSPWSLGHKIVDSLFGKHEFTYFYSKTD